MKHICIVVLLLLNHFFHYFSDVHIDVASKIFHGISKPDLNYDKNFLLIGIVWMKRGILGM